MIFSPLDQSPLITKTLEAAKVLANEYMGKEDWEGEPVKKLGIYRIERVGEVAARTAPEAQDVICPRCNGAGCEGGSMEGSLNLHACPMCGGKKRISAPEAQRLDIPCNLRRHCAKPNGHKPPCERQSGTPVAAPEAQR